MLDSKSVSIYSYLMNGAQKNERNKARFRITQIS
jgi:hypothetical protein